MHCYSDVLGDEGRRVLESCVKVKIYGRPENLQKYVLEKALDRLDRCYAAWMPGICGGVVLKRWLPYPRYSMLPTEFDEYAKPNTEKRYDIIDVHNGLVSFDKMAFAERYPNPGPRYIEMKELIDKRRADVERECKEAVDNPDKQCQYSWIVAQRRVKDCFAGSFARDVGLLELEPEHTPSEPYSIIEIHDAVAHWDEASVFGTLSFHGRENCNDGWWKKANASRDNVEKELNEAKVCSNDKMLREYSRSEAEKRVKDCYPRFRFPPNVDVLPIKKDNNCVISPIYDIFDIDKAIQCLDERKLLQKYSEGEGPGCDELNRSIDACRCGIEGEYQEAKNGLHRYSKREAEQRVQNCFDSRSAVGCTATSPGDFPCREYVAKETNSNQMYDIFDIHKMLLCADQRDRHSTVRNLKNDCLGMPGLTKSDKAVLAERDAISKEYQKAKKSLHEYSRNEAERRVRDCFAGTHPYDTDIFPKKEEKDGIPKTQQTYNIFEIKNAIDHFDGKKFREKYVADEDPESKCRNERADKERAEIEEEYAEATKKIEIENGSGFIIHDHFIITNKHVIEGAFNDKTVGDKSELQGHSHSKAEQKVNVVNDITNENDDRKEIFISNVAIGELPCEIIHHDTLKDLALLYCRGLNLKENGICPLQLSNHSLLPGIQIFSFGYPRSHKGNNAVFVNGYVSGSEETFNHLCSLKHTMAVLNCSLNHGNSGSPVLCWVKGQLKVVGIATQKHIKEILTLEERTKIETIRDSLQTSSIPSVSDEAIQYASSNRERSNDFCPSPDPCQTPMFLLTLKLYDALETRSQFNLSNAVPGHCMVEFVREFLRKYKGEGRKELAEVVRLSEDRDNVLPSGNHSASECCVQ